MKIFSSMDKILLGLTLTVSLVSLTEAADPNDIQDKHNWRTVHSSEECKQQCDQKDQNCYISRGDFRFQQCKGTRVKGLCFWWCMCHPKSTSTVSQGNCTDPFQGKPNL